MKQVLKQGFYAGMLLLLAACGTQNQPPSEVKVGKPYSVAGQTYTPAYDEHYDETGVASWYGPGFHGNKTASGEKYDQADFTAAHRTLPMPSLVRVTNLENNSTIIVRINDRGPFASGRIIDLSRASARALGITGTANVRVQYLPEETARYWSRMHLNTQDIQFAANDPNAPRAPEPLDTSENSPSKAAPVLSVASNDLQPPPGAIQESEQAQEDTPSNTPFQTGHSKFHVVSEADAAESTPEASAAAKPKIVQLMSTDAEDEAQAPRPAADPPDEPVPRAALRNGYFVQAGVFSSEANAQKLAARLESVGSAKMETVAAGGKTLHRLRIGPFLDRASAQQALARVAEQAPGAMIVKE